MLEVNMAPGTIMTLEGVGALLSLGFAVFVFIYTNKHNRNTELNSNIEENAAQIAELGKKVEIMENKYYDLKDNSQNEQFKEILDHLQCNYNSLAKELAQMNTSIAVIVKSIEVLEKHNEEISNTYNKVIDSIITKKVI